jgi:alanyl-tRNA synthetase
VALVVGGEQVSHIADGQQAAVVLNQTPFYGEMGGQVGDTGLITLQDANGEPTATFEVTDTKIHDGVYVHMGTISGRLTLGDKVVARIDRVRRARIQRNHTATHLLQYALREVLGGHVAQAGSLVAPDHLRFDFTHFEAMTAAQIAEVERIVNELIVADSVVETHESSLSEARASGATALFGEKYGEVVRVVEAGSESRELCGGTHVAHTGDIGLFKIITEASAAASVRRITAVTSMDALQYLDAEETELRRAAAVLKCPPAEVASKIAALQARNHELEAELAAGKAAAAASTVGALLAGAVDAGGYQLVIGRLDGMDVQGLRQAWDEARKQLGSAAAVVFGTITPAGSPLLLAAGTKPAVAAGFDAGAVIKQCAPAIKGGGGGKPAMAQAGGKDAEGLNSALALAKKGLIGQ